MLLRITRSDAWLILLGCFLCVAARLSHSGFVSRLSKFETQDPRIEFVSDKDFHFSTFGFDFLISDVLWLTFIQTVGDRAIPTSEKAMRCSRYLQSVVELNPAFVPAYYFAAFVLGGDCHRPDLARTIIERGLRFAPKDWNLFFVAGINEYLFAKNPLAAASYYKTASNLPGAPRWLANQVLILGQDIPTVLKEVSTWNAIYNSAKNEQVRQNAKVHLALLWSEIYSQAPTSVIKDRAAQSLKELGAK